MIVLATGHRVEFIDLANPEAFIHEYSHEAEVSFVTFNKNGDKFIFSYSGSSPVAMIEHAKFGTPKRAIFSIPLKAIKMQYIR